YQRSLPGHIAVVVTGYRNAGTGIIVVGTESAAHARVLHIHIGKVSETILGASDGVVTHQSVSCPELQIGDNRFNGLPKIFVRHIPGNASRRKETEALILVEALRDRKSTRLNSSHV